MENNKKIVFICNGDHPGTQGGVQTFGRMINQFFFNEVEFIAYASNREKIYKFDNVIEVGKKNLVFRVVNKLLKNRIRDYEVRQQIKKIEPEICILRTPRDIKVLKGIKVKKILVQHVNFDIYIKEDFKDKYVRENLVKEIDKFILLSKYDREKVIEELKFPEEKTEVIRHSSEVDINYTQKNKNKKMVMICRLVNSHKRLDLAIKAMKQLKDFTLDIYGDGPDKEKIIEFIKNENINNVFLKGITTKISDTLDKYSIFIMTSDYEGYGITNIEAMRRALPIILRNTFEAAADIVVDNKNGILLPKKWNEKEFIDSVQKIYENFNFYSNNARELARRYDVEVIKEMWKKELKNSI